MFCRMARAMFSLHYRFGEGDCTIYTLSSNPEGSVCRMAEALSVKPFDCRLLQALTVNNIPHGSLCCRVAQLG